MTPPALMLLVRFRSRLTLDQVMRVVDERASEFEALAGLEQKYYLQDAESGEYAGCYLWASAEALDEYRSSELRASIGVAYETDEDPRVEVYRILKLLRD